MPLWRRRRSPVVEAEARHLPRDAADAAGAALRLWYIQHIDLFQGMTPHEMSVLAQRTVMRKYKRGEVIARADDPPEGIYLIKEGRVRLCRYSSAGRVQTMAVLERGNIFGERVLSGAPAAASCEAFDDAVVCILKREDFEDLMRAKPDIALRVMRALAERLHQAENAIESLGLHGVPRRLAVLLVRLADTYGEPREDTDGRRLAVRFTHDDLASMVGATRETVTVVLNRFRDDGLITIEDRYIVVRDTDRLLILQ